MSFRKFDCHIPTDPAALGYIAGIIDGEGYIGINNAFDKKKSRSVSASLRVVVTNTAPSLIVWLAEQIGGSGGYRKEIRDGQRKPQYVWSIHAQNAAALLRAVLPYLVIKRDQADIALTFIALKPTRSRWKIVDPVVLAQREALRQQLMTLTKMGVHGTVAPRPIVLEPPLPSGIQLSILS